ncbi:leukemia-associated protein 7 [Spea bombifrons]|uniref:leukemia-associated protein 7 n=1 Tax=Spea bombifrons TaxID=233779 RepID=UPI00234A842F|nr:leukemia-associated protein 7 [Spea bombifrons]
MPGPALVGVTMIHQATAFSTLRTLIEQRGVSILEPQMYLKEETYQELIGDPRPLNGPSELVLLHNDSVEGTASSRLRGPCSQDHRAIVDVTSALGEDPASLATETPKHNAGPSVITRTETPGSGPATHPGKAPTLAQIASRNRLSRVLHCTAQLLLVEQDALNHLPLDHPVTIQLKDSIEFRNICTHMALQIDDRKFDKDLNAANECLRTIITDLILALSVFSSDFFESATEKLRQILKNLDG